MIKIDTKIDNITPLYRFQESDETRLLKYRMFGMQT